MKRWLLLLGLLAASLAPPAWAMDGQALQEGCEEALKGPAGMARASLLTRTLLAGQCLGMMEGLRDVSYAQQALRPGSALFCLPDGTSVSQLARTVVQHLQDHPDKLGMSGGALAIEAMRAAHPCARGEMESQNTLPARAQNLNTEVEWQDLQRKYRQLDRKWNPLQKTQSPRRLLW
jgi:Rap1a immunity proteins